MAKSLPSQAVPEHLINAYQHFHAELAQRQKTRRTNQYVQVKDILQPLLDPNHPLALQGVDLSHSDCSDLELIGADLRGANFTKSLLDGSIFCATNLEQACLVQTSMKRVEMQAVSLKTANAQGSNWQSSILENVDAEGLNLVSAQLTDSQWAFAAGMAKGIILNGANLAGMVIDVQFQALDLSGAGLATDFSAMRFAHLNQQTVINISGASFDVAANPLSKVFEVAQNPKTLIEGVAVRSLAVLAAEALGASFLAAPATILALTVATHMVLNDTPEGKKNYNRFLEALTESGSAIKTDPLRGVRDLHIKITGLLPTLPWKNKKLPKHLPGTR
ncbi:MAG: pentapeptide repeat-containing protein [Alphaproteobacteria bacterium]